MKFCLALIILASLFTSCAHKKMSTGVSITTASRGLMKNHIADFPIYLTDKVENRNDLEKKYSSDIFIVHTGHLLRPNLNKIENEKNLQALVDQGYNLVNLTLEDFVVAGAQGINFENFESLAFLNSSVIDLNLDDLATGKNISPFIVYDGLAFIGLSDAKLAKNLTPEKYIISDYVLSILKVKKAALKTDSADTLKSFILVHTLENEIKDVMVRLPPSFINSLAN